MSDQEQPSSWTERDHIASLEKSIVDLTRKRDHLEYELLSRQAHRHHEVLCLVLKAQLPREINHDCEDVNAQALVNIARRYADLAYPPPKAEGT